MSDPLRGEVWLVDLDPTRGREQRGRRPALVLSVDEFNSGPADLVVVAPLTTTDRKIPWHVPVSPPEGGVRRPSFAKCEDVRSIARERLVDCWGMVSRAVMGDVEDRLRILLDL